MTIRRPSISLYSIVLIMLFLAIGFVTLALTSQSVGRQLFKYNLESFEYKRSNNYLQSIQSTAILLDNLQYHLSYTCDNEDISELERASYYSSNIRNISLTTNSGKICGDRTNLSQMYGSPIKKIQLNNDLAMVANANNSESILQYSKKVVGGVITVDIEKQPIDALLVNTCDNCWVQTIEHDGITLYTSNTENASKALFKQPAVNDQQLKNAMEPIISRPFYKKASITYYITPQVITDYRARIKPFLLLVLSGLIFIVLIMLYRRYRSTSIIKYLILNAIKQNHLVPYYQPIIDAEKHLTCGYEVLIRWETKKGKVILPDEFIPQCETNGVITPLTFQLINTVARDIHKLEALHGKTLPYYFSINISASVLQDPELIDITRSALAHYHIAPHNIAFELTERSPIDNIEQAEKNCQKLNAMGVQIKLDDVGNGHCDLLSLQRLQATTIKIDKVFIADIGSSNANTIIKSLAAFAEQAEVEIIAEGIETQQQAEILLDIGIRYHQGFLYSKPMPFDLLINDKHFNV
ncbi:putative membrane protein YjcC [Photobacterium piscicola]|uniref:Putative membrane protein YjcC n=1 Tax=Photobacterium piscicola TaxID=1378299 RepID=A0A1T5I1N1_9GAMM|nr:MULTISPECIES: EAL domain-containing protein [Photobacterium]SKC32922.1 putative membrane protein YjcC [Photobacterium piscicola]